MYSIRKEYIRFCETTQYCVDLLKVKDNTGIRKNVLIRDVYEPKEVYILSSGVLNAIWQAWNRYWRIYWLTYIFGGISYTGLVLPNSIGSLGTTTTTVCEGAAIYNLLSLTRFNVSRFRNGIIQPYQEPTWGDVGLIEKISLACNSSGMPGTQILSAFSVFGDSASHLQKVRNCSVHISKEGIKDLKRDVLPKYKASSFKYPTDIIFYEELGSTNIAITSWINELTAVLELI
ncbi:hypothetical protein [Clostridium tagluense]|uniref:hypothetical protein n=1 Tax=Clostridium tagluense TaxID=360422 RepID=UPI001C6DFE7C|nr:hypothetical protein [Clostridium tagluense]MBW9157679.1 hypothetical protein [Clostridium tagluense]WLC67040.1 hypothetical protein KTC93_07610 [Clostridium tagluense]